MTQPLYFDWSVLSKKHKWMDFGFMCMTEPISMVVVDAFDFAYNAGTNILSWSTFQIRSLISGGVLTINGGSMAAGDKDVIYIRDVDHPFEDATKTLSVGAPSDDAVRRPTNLFIGVIDTDTVYLLPSAGGPDVKMKFTEYAFLPVEWAQDGAMPPSTLSDFIAGNGTLRVRAYSGSGDHDLTFPWEIPNDLYVPDGIQYQVLGVILGFSMVNAYAYFDLRGYAIDDNESIDQSWGTAVVVLPGGTYDTQHRVISSFSAKVDVANMGSGKLAMLNLRRRANAIEDTFGGVFYVYGMNLKWSRMTGT